MMIIWRIIDERFMAKFSSPPMPPKTNSSGLVRDEMWMKSYEEIAAGWTVARRCLLLLFFLGLFKYSPILRRKFPPAQTSFS